MLNLLVTVRTIDKKLWDNKIEWNMDGLGIVPCASDDTSKLLELLENP